jgi:uncharacterized protein YceK
MTRNQTLTLIAAAILCVGLTGCGSISSVESLGGGYEEVTYTQTSLLMEPDAHQITLQYRKPNGRQIMIWPSATGGKIVKKEVVIFEADKAWKQPKPGERWPMKSRLFAARAPDFPLDITDEILWRSTKSSGEDFSKLLKTATIAYFKGTNNAVEFHFGVMRQPDFPELTISLNWDQIVDIMREVKEKGVVRKDLRWGTSYIEKEFKPETTDK